MNKLILTALGSITAVALWFGGGAIQANACYVDSHGDGFGQEWFAEGELGALDQAFFFATEVQRIHEVMVEEWQASPTAYDAKYGPLFEVTLAGMVQADYNGDGFVDKLGKFDGIVRTKFIVYQALSHFKVCE